MSTTKTTTATTAEPVTAREVADMLRDIAELSTTVDTGRRDEVMARKRALLARIEAE